MRAARARVRGAQRAHPRQPDRGAAGRGHWRPRRDPEPGRLPAAGRGARRRRPRLPRGAGRLRAAARSRRRLPGHRRGGAAARDRGAGQRGPGVPGPQRLVARAGGDRGGIVCLLSDVTPLRELEEQLRLKEALARLGELTAGIAHEFRNGLATIHGYSRLLRPDALPEAYRPYVDGIRQESEALGHVMTNFLKFARPDAGGVRRRGPAGDRPARGGRPGPRAAAADRRARRGHVRAGGRRRGAAAAGVRQPGAQRRRGVRHRAGGADGARPRVGGRSRVPRVGGRQRPRHPGRHAARASSSRSSRRARAAPAWGWPSSRRWWSTTTAACRPRARRSAARRSTWCSRCRARAHPLLSLARLRLARRVSVFLPALRAGECRGSCLSRRANGHSVR